MAQKWRGWRVNDLQCWKAVLVWLTSFLQLVAASVPTYHMSDFCSSTLDMGTAKVMAGRLLLHRPQLNLQTLDCRMLIKAPANKMLTFKFQQFNIKSQHGCNSNHLQIFEDTQGHIQITDKLCNTHRPDRAYVTSGEEATLQLTKDVFQGDSFELVFTAFRFAPCVGNEYKCDNSHCIHKDLYCNGLDNCGDRSDICLLRKEAIVGIVAASAVIFFLCAVVIIVCMVRRQRKIRRERVSG